jgi:hypothetical protein
MRFASKMTASTLPSSGSASSIRMPFRAAASAGPRLRDLIVGGFSHGSDLIDLATIDELGRCRLDHVRRLFEAVEAERKELVRATAGAGIMPI